METGPFSPLPPSSATSSPTGVVPDLSTDASWRTQNLGALLFAATDRSTRDKLLVLHAGGFGTISEAQLSLFYHLDGEGTRITKIAARSGLTKQAMIELVDRAEALKLIGRRADPGDRRAKIVYPTADGLALLATLERGIVLAEARIADVMGGNFIAEMKLRLCAYAAAEADAAPVTTGAAWRARSSGRLLSVSARRFAAQALAAARRNGQADVAEVLLALFRNLDLGGTRLTDIAARARMTKQSMRELVDRAEALGLVERRPDPADRRAKIIRFTGAGLAMLDDLRDGVGQAEQAFRASAGSAFTSRFKVRLLDYAAASLS